MRSLWLNSWMSRVVALALGSAVLLTSILAVRDRAMFLEDAQASSEQAARYLVDRILNSTEAAQRAADWLGESGSKHYFSGLRHMEFQQSVEFAARTMEFFVAYELLDRNAGVVFRWGGVPAPNMAQGEPGSASPATARSLSGEPSPLPLGLGTPRLDRASGKTALPVTSHVHDPSGRLALYSVVYLDTQAMGRAVAHQFPMVDRMRVIDLSGNQLLAWPQAAHAEAFQLPAGALPARCASRDDGGMAMCARAGPKERGWSVLVERRWSSILAEWYRDLAFYLSIALLSLIALVIFMRLQLQGRIGASDRKASELSMDMFEAGVLVFSERQQLIFSNSAAQTLLGIPRQMLAKGAPFLSVCEAVVRSEGIRDPADRQSRLNELLEDWGALKSTREIERQTATGRRLRFARADNAAGMSALLVTDVTVARNQSEELNMLRQMDEVAQITAGSSHDFNNTLTAIGGQVDLGRELLRQGKYPEAEARLDSAVEAIARGAKIVRILLGFSRVDRSKSEYINVCQFLTQRSNTLAGLAGRRSGYRQVIPDAPCWVQVDAAGLSSVVENLVANARDAMPEGGLLNVTVSRQFVRTARTVASGELLRPGNYVRIEVADTGSGIDQSTLRRIFQPFFTTKPKHAGSGLGLAQVRNFCRMHLGAIDVATSPGSGTTMLVWLPEAKTPDPACAPSGTGPASV